MVNFLSSLLCCRPPPETDGDAAARGQQAAGAFRGRKVSVDATAGPARVCRTQPPGGAVQQPTSAPAPGDANRIEKGAQKRAAQSQPLSGPDVNAADLELKSEIRKAVAGGYAREIIDVGHPDCTHPASAEGFRDIVASFNRAMADFHHRFPELRRLQPPILTRKDPAVAHDRPELYATYYPAVQAIGFREVATPGEWQRDTNAGGDQRFAPAKGFGGHLAHEYGHHLSFKAVVPPSVWKPKLEAMLQAHGHVSRRSSISTMLLPYDDAFALRVGKLARDLGIGNYAGTHPVEFAAEAIAWRLHPDYGATSDAPRMPRYLENWVHECFPFLDNGQIPEPAIEFDPDHVKEPVYRAGAVEWVPRGELRAIRERAESASND